MNATSGLLSECLHYLNRPLEIKFEAGWGWTVQKDFGKSAVEFSDIEKVNCTIGEITPKRFYRHHGILRAFKGDITGFGHYFGSSRFRVGKS